MNTESKGRAWYDKIYRKLETILVDVDNLASQGKVSLKSSDPPGLDFVRDEPEKVADDPISSLDTDRLSAQSTHPTRETLITATTCNDDTFVISTADSNLKPLATEIQPAAGQDELTSFSSNSIKGNQDEFFFEDFDAALLDTIDLYDMTFREDHSDFDDNLLYAARDRTRQLRSFKRKLMDALTSKRRREKEYEQLAIWFGDADLSCDLMNTKEHATTSLDSKSSRSNVPFASEDSEWELL